MTREHSIEVMLGRRSTRRYASRPVSDEDIATVVTAGLRAPSSKNSQPWHIAVLKGAAKERLCTWVEENPELLPTKPGVLLIDEPQARTRDSTTFTLRYVRSAPVLVLIFNRAPFWMWVLTILSGSITP